MNTVILRGNVTRDAELKVVTPEFSVCNFSIAYNHYVKGKTEQDVSYFDFKCFNKQAEYFVKNIHKGDRIAIEASAKQERWVDKDGKTQSKIIFSCRSIDKLEKIHKNEENVGNAIDADLPF
jgi:single-strand DNA-binding protein